MVTLENLPKGISIDLILTVLPWHCHVMDVPGIKLRMMLARAAFCAEVISLISFVDFYSPTILHLFGVPVFGFDK